MRVKNHFDFLSIFFWFHFTFILAFADNLSIAYILVTDRFYSHFSLNIYNHFYGRRNQCKIVHLYMKHNFFRNVLFPSTVTTKQQKCNFCVFPIIRIRENILVSPVSWWLRLSPKVLGCPTYSKRCLSI